MKAIFSGGVTVTHSLVSSLIKQLILMFDTVEDEAPYI